MEDKFARLFADTFMLKSNACCGECASQQKIINAILIIVIICLIYHIMIINHHHACHHHHAHSHCVLPIRSRELIVWDGQRFQKEALTQGGNAGAANAIIPLY